MKKSILLLFCSVMALILAACSGEKADSQNENITAEDPAPASTSDDFGYRIGYELGDEFTGIFTDMPSEAFPGDIVEIRTGILFDAGIHVYVEGQEIGMTHYDSDYWGYSFIMPDKDVTVTARFYTKDEVWGTEKGDLTALREMYPEYFDLPTGKGLEVYVWQMAPDSYSCGVMAGTNRYKELEELMNLKGASVGEMKAILSGYDIPKENIFIIPWQNPISSYLSEYWIIAADESPESAASRRRAYIDTLRGMLLGDETPVTKAAYANWTEDSRIFACLNAEKMSIGSVRHLPVYRFDTKEDLAHFRETFRDILTLDRGYNEVPSFNEAVSGYDDAFFADHTVILAYVTAGSGSLRFAVRDVSRDGSSLCLNVVQTNHPEAVTDDMAGWFVMAEIPDADIRGIADFDAKLAAD